jgi:hypothetical protein
MSINASDKPVLNKGGLKPMTTENTDPYLARNSFEVNNAAKKIGDWEQFNWYLRYVDADGSPVPAAIWVKQLIKQFDYTYTELDRWLQASAYDPEWDCAIYAGFDSQGNAYIAARNEDVS